MRTKLALIAGIIGLSFALIFLLYAQVSPFPIQEWPAGVVAGVVGAIGLIAGVTKWVSLRRTDEPTRLTAVAVGLCGVAMLTGITISVVIWILQYYSLAGWGEADRMRALANEIESSQRRGDLVRAERAASDLVRGWPNKPMHHGLLHEMAGRRHWSAAEYHIFESGDLKAAEKEIALADAEFDKAKREYRKTGKRGTIEYFGKVLKNFRVTKRDLAKAEREEEEQARAAKRAKARKKRRRPSKSPSKVKAKDTPKKSNSVDVKRIAGEKKRAVAKYLGKPSKCKPTKGLGAGDKCFYRDGKVEVVYVNSRADWITVYAPEIKFSAYALGDFNIRVGRPPDFHSQHVYRWKNLDGFREVSLFPGKGDRVHYLHVCTTRVP